MDARAQFENQLPIQLQFKPYQEIPVVEESEVIAVFRYDRDSNAAVIKIIVCCEKQRRFKKKKQLSQRLSSLQTQLEFLNNYYQFSLDFLNQKRLKNITGITEVQQLVLNNSSTHPMTRSLAELMVKIKTGSDHMSSQILADAATQIECNVKTIISQFDSVIAFLREVYNSTFAHLTTNQISN